MYVRLFVALLLGNVCTAVEIQDFQPSVIPVRSSTRLTILTTDQLNASTGVQCRLGDMSVPAEVNDGLIFCDTPPVKDIDKAALHLEVDGKLFKAKKPLRFHDPFKVTDISPKLAAPAELLKVKISGIKCEKWMQFFVRFQSANATKATQEGVCNNATVICYIPEFPANTLLRVGATLSNRIVEWSPSKLRIQYPVDAMKSSLTDLVADTSKRGAFDFKVILKDKFQNHIHLSDDVESNSVLSVQYAPFGEARNFKFIKCDISTTHEQAGSVYSVSCVGADHERILIYPSINNVPVGGTESYEVTTTLCPGKYSCHDNSKTTIIIAVCSVFGGAALLVSAVILYRRRFQGNLQIRSKDQARDEVLLRHPWSKDQARDEVLLRHLWSSQDRSEISGNEAAVPGSVEDIVAPDLTDPDTCKEQRPLTRRSSKEDDCASTEQLGKDYPEDKNPESISKVTVAAEDFFKTTGHCDSLMREISEGYEMTVIKGENGAEPTKNTEKECNVETLA